MAQMSSRLDAAERRAAEAEAQLQRQAITFKAQMSAAARSRSQSPMHTVDIASTRHYNAGHDNHYAQLRDHLRAETQELVSHLQLDFHTTLESHLAEMKLLHDGETRLSTPQPSGQPSGQFRASERLPGGSTLDAQTEPRYTVKEWNEYQARLYEDLDNYETTNDAVAAAAQPTFDSIVAQHGSHARYPHSDPGGRSASQLPLRVLPQQGPALAAVPGLATTQ